MRISVQLSAIKETKWYEYVVRFLFGGLVTATAGLIATKFGPVVGGLFLAFPAIFPASATLVEKHETKRKEEAGMDGKKRGRAAASIDATGAAIGSIGLLVFGGSVWLLLPRFAPWLVLVVATIGWFVTSAIFWIIRKRL